MYYMIKIRIFTDFHKATDDPTSNYLESSGMKLDPDYNKTFCFTSGDDYTHVILLNCPTPNISHIPKKNVIGIAMEPVQFLRGFAPICPSVKLKDFIEYVQKYVGKYYVGDQFDLPKPFIERCRYRNSSIQMVPYPEKKKIMSIMISNKVSAPGHKYRHMLVLEILKHNLPVDIYGRGCVYYKQYDVRFKGFFKDNEPYEDYKFHIAIENFESNHYFTEKIINPLLLNCSPIYLGCRNIDEYFPDVVIKLNGDIEHDIKLIKSICDSHEKYQKQIDIDKIQKTISIKNLINEFTN